MDVPVYRCVPNQKVCIHIIILHFKVKITVWLWLSLKKKGEGEYFNGARILVIQSVFNHQPWQLSWTWEHLICKQEVVATIPVLNDDLLQLSYIHIAFLRNC